MNYERVRGMYDILPDEIEWWRVAERAMIETARRYNYREIRFPIVEYTELFARGMGEATDVVGKEMYTFEDRKGRSLTLRPEGTASVARAYLNQGWATQSPFQKLFYIGPMFRYEKPQKGRCRQFHQFGIEALGSLDPSLDAEVISFAWSMMDTLGIGGLWLRLNSIGCAEDRERYRQILREHFGPSIKRMCVDCQRRYEENPLRILDCKESQCQPFIDEAPGSADHLCKACAGHFAEVRELLDLLGLEYEIDPRLVRGIDYYTRTVFELMSKDLGSQDTLIGGGRYDGLVETFGGPPTPALGFAGGFERLVIVLQERSEAEATGQGSIDLFLATIGPAGRRHAFALAEQLRRMGLSVDIDHRDRSLRKQLTLANQLQARHLLVIGDSETDTHEGKIKHMDSGEEVDISLDPAAIAAFLREGD
jgi:histidyl-tRNA synthetase